MHLLLDFDGVILKNNKLTQYQFEKSCKFVQRHTCLNIDTCRTLNRKYYPVYGHSVTMLNTMFNKKISVEEYDEYVFNKRTLNKLVHLVDDDTLKHSSMFEYIFKHCEKNNIKWNIFSNAHINWIILFSQHMKLNDITEGKVVWPQSKLNLLKPNEEAYDNIEKMFPSSNLFTFIDDSYVNLDIVQKREKWRTYQMQNDTSFNDLMYFLENLI